MTTTTPTTPVATPDVTAATSATGAAPARGGQVHVLAMGLWAVVGSLLAYGVAQTVVKAASLFG